MKVSAFVLTGWKVCSECLLVVCWLHGCSDLQLLFWVARILLLVLSLGA